MEFTGVPAAFVEGLHLVRPGGRYLIVGQLGTGTTEFQPSLIVKKNINVIGSLSGDARSYSLALDFISGADGRLAARGYCINEARKNRSGSKLRRRVGHDRFQLRPWRQGLLREIGGLLALMHEIDLNGLRSPLSPAARSLRLT